MTVGDRWLVTGGSGLIGGWLLRKLIGQHYSVLNFDLNESGTLPSHGTSVEAVSVFGDILDYEQISNTIREYQPDVVVHLAAQSGVEAARWSPMTSLKLSTVGTAHVLEVCRLQEVPRVLVASSNHIYGRQEGLTTEDAPLNQLDLYSVSKTCADYLARAYAHNYGMNVVAVRPTNTYGPCDPHEDHIIPGTIQRVLDGKHPVIKSAGQVKKSYLYGEDCANAFITIGEHAEELAGQAVNVVGSGPIGALGLAQTICSLINPKLKPKVLGEPNDQNDEWLSGDKLAALGWKPQYTLREGLEKTIEWFRNQSQARAA